MGLPSGRLGPSCGDDLSVVIAFQGLGFHFAGWKPDWFEASEVAGLGG